MRSVEAVEEIIRSLDKIDQDEKGQFLAAIPETELYEAALTVMMRLVFLFSALRKGAYCSWATRST